VTDFSGILVADEGQTASVISLVGVTELPAWLESLSEAERVWLNSQKFAAKSGDLQIYPDAAGNAVAVLGMGSTNTLSTWSLASAASRLPAGTYRLAASSPVDAQQALLGWLLAHYDFTAYKQSKNGDLRKLVLPENANAADAVALARAIALVRDLVTTPAADMGPAELSAAAKKVADECGAAFSEIVGEDLLTQNFPSIHAVGRGSPRAPRLIDILWGNPDHPKVTLVGKGVCFDTGGYNMKGGTGMGLMKKDMGGAAHVLALAQLVMQANLPVRLRVLIPAVENMISGNAFVPGDVLATRQGLTVEVTNTDAEGRLVLSDALTLACEDKPDVLLDFATLTGAARVALGPDLPPMFTTDDVMAEALLLASRTMEDPVWRLPLWAGYDDMLTSSIANLQNSPDSGFAGAITAALFLKRFVSVPAWAHFDVYAWNLASKPGRPKGGEAMGLLTSWFYLSQRFVRR
jgi:leucyl aminopeptidase